MRKHSDESRTFQNIAKFCARLCYIRKTLTFKVSVSLQPLSKNQRNTGMRFKHCGLIFGGILFVISLMTVEAGFIDRFDRWKARRLGREFSHNALGSFPYFNYFQLLSTAHAVQEIIFWENLYDTQLMIYTLLA